MSVNSLNTPIDYSMWKPITGDSTKTNTYATYETDYNTQTDSFESSYSETCTDGKDDGKIGFGSALWNTLKGVGKTVVNGVKGMFTNKEGCRLCSWWNDGGYTSRKRHIYCSNS